MYNEKDIKRAIDELVDSNILIYQEQSQSYSLIENSNVNINKELKSRLEKNTNINIEKKLTNIFKINLLLQRDILLNMVVNTLL